MNQEEQWLLNEKYNGVQSEAFKEDVTHLRNGEPLAYLIGHVPFSGTTIYLDSRPLIPRPETEYLVSLALNDIPEDRMYTVLDLFSGSGCVGVSILKKRPLIHVTFAELHEEHLPTIKKNINENALAESQTHIVSSDVWSALTTTYDYVIANPPYISRERHTVDASVVHHEPHTALFAENDGFILIEKTILGLSTHLSKDGVSWIEHEPFHKENIDKVAREHNLTVTHHKDQFGVIRFSRFVRNDV